MKKKVASQEQNGHAKLVLPGLDPSGPYLSRLSARSALYTELHLLLDAVSHSKSALDFRGLIVDENRLSRPTASARAKLWQELKTRYRLNPVDPMLLAFLDEWWRCKSEAERGLTAYILFALNDRLVCDLGTEWLFPLLRRAPVEMRVVDVRAFLQRASLVHPEVNNWSEETNLAVAQKYCASIRDFGLATGKVRKWSVRPALYASPVRLLVKALRLIGTSPIDLVCAPIFRLLAFEGPEIIDALGELNRIGALRFRMQSDVVELEVQGSLK